MPDLAVLAIGQSNMRSSPKSIGGDMTVPANLKVWGDGEAEFGTGWRTARFGQYPLDMRLAVGEAWANSLALSFCRELSGTYDPYLAVVAKGGHPIESFIVRTTREANRWPIPRRKTNLAPFLYQPQMGCAKALARIGKTRFNVVIFHQGTANREDSANLYARKMEGLIGDLQRAGLIGRATPIIAGTHASTVDYYAVHRTGLLLAASRDPRIVVVEAGDLPLVDEVHFTGAALVELGQRYAAAFTA